MRRRALINSVICELIVVCFARDREQAVLKGKNRQARKQEETDTRRSLFDTVVGSTDQHESLLDR